MVKFRLTNLGWISYLQIIHRAVYGLRLPGFVKDVNIFTFRRRLASHLPTTNLTDSKNAVFVFFPRSWSSFKLLSNSSSTHEHSHLYTITFLHSLNFANPKSSAVNAPLAITVLSSHSYYFHIKLPTFENYTHRATMLEFVIIIHVYSCECR